MHCFVSGCPFPYAGVPFPILLLCSSSQWDIPNPGLLFPVPNALFPILVHYPPPQCPVPLSHGYSPSFSILVHYLHCGPSFPILVPYSLSPWVFPIPVFCSLSRWLFLYPSAPFPHPGALFPLGYSHSQDVIPHPSGYSPCRWIFPLLMGCSRGVIPLPLGIPHPDGYSPSSRVIPRPLWVIPLPRGLFPSPCVSFPVRKGYSPPRCSIPPPDGAFHRPVRYSPARCGVPGALFPLPVCISPSDRAFPSPVRYSPSVLIPVRYSLFPVPCSLFPMRYSLYPVRYSPFPVIRSRGRSRGGVATPLPPSPPNRLSTLHPEPRLPVTSRTALPAAPLPRERARVRGAGPARSRPVTR